MTKTLTKTADATPTPTICVICTNHDRIDEQVRTGLWLEEFVVPMAIFEAAGFEAVVASPRGGEVPIDARSLASMDSSKQAVIARLFDSASVRSLKSEDFDAVFFPGGHGPVFDLAFDALTHTFVGEVFDKGGIVGAVCHGPAALLGIESQGRPLLRDRRVTAFSNAEEEQTGLAAKLPFLIETKFGEQGADYSAAAPWQSYVVTDGALITGQNPASSAGVAKQMVASLS